ncbi:MAG TPA: SUMF1/EgtB/PvdO family nonheme iron enzyme [Solirubrobacteraceae bacterium]|nr:SUMF1/EgtB/PvdO family nonheme iron enzyme [Solirubrobacteraceae bacterium]
MATIANRDPIAPPHPLPADWEEALAALDTARERTLALVGRLSDEQLSSVLSPIMSPLVWDLAHIAAYEDLWLAHRHGGLPLLRPDLAELYDAFETPRSVRGEIELLDPPRAREYLSEVRSHTAQALARRGVGDGTIYELVLRHELQHTETMRQTMALAGLLPPGEPRLAPLAGVARGGERPPMGADPDGHTQRAHGKQADTPQDASEWIDVPAGPFEMGAGPSGFAYDNERPRHTIELPAFQIARLPVTNATWERLGAGVREGHPDATACHVNWFEADALARAAGARLPSEAEWEKAAKAGLLAGVGQVWEWTSSCFEGYPGFAAHPYREYSEVFFGEDYRVLRGSSWATDPHVASTTFRNWDLPIRSQIFAGLRLARDAA